MDVHINLYSSYMYIIYHNVCIYCTYNIYMFAYMCTLV